MRGGRGREKPKDGRRDSGKQTKEENLELELREEREEGKPKKKVRAGGSTCKEQNSGREKNMGEGGRNLKKFSRMVKCLS
jgi:hypothetical protein